jgi:hypothetical protein
MCAQSWKNRTKVENSVACQKISPRYPVLNEGLLNLGEGNGGIKISVSLNELKVDSPRIYWLSSSQSSDVVPLLKTAKVL